MRINGRVDQVARAQVSGAQLRAMTTRVSVLGDSSDDSGDVTDGSLSPAMIVAPAIQPIVVTSQVNNGWDNTQLWGIGIAIAVLLLVMMDHKKGRAR
jgi:hypothetical protein